MKLATESLRGYENYFNDSLKEVFYKDVPTSELRTETAMYPLEFFGVLSDTKSIEPIRIKQMIAYLNDLADKGAFYCSLSGGLMKVNFSNGKTGAICYLCINPDKKEYLYPDGGGYLKEGFAGWM